MSKRLQVLLDEAEFDEIRETAERQRLTVADWVRRSLREARAGEPAHDPQAKLDALERALAEAHPTGDVDQMLAEIEAGYLPESNS